jgi:hypothetical protein
VLYELRGMKETTSILLIIETEQLQPLGADLISIVIKQKDISLRLIIVLPHRMFLGHP